MQDCLKDLDTYKIGNDSFHFHLDKFFFLGWHNLKRYTTSHEL